MLSVKAELELALKAKGTFDLSQLTQTLGLIYHSPSSSAALLASGGDI